MSAVQSTQPRAESKSARRTTTAITTTHSRPAKPYPEFPCTPTRQVIGPRRSGGDSTTSPPGPTQMALSTNT